MIPLIASLLVVMSSVGPAAALTIEAPLVLWVWERPTSAVIDTAVADGFGTVYLHVPPGSSSNGNMRRFVQSAHQASVEVFALAGVPGWAQEPDSFYAWLDEVVESGQFDGIVVDIEPYLLPDWKHPKRRAGLMDDYLDVLDGARVKAGALPVVATVPFWWDDPRYQVGRDSLLIEEVLKRADTIAVMAYRDLLHTNDGIVALTSSEITMAAASGKQAVVTLQVAPDTLSKVTFAEEGHDALVSAAASLAEIWQVGRGFGGIAIHSFGPYVELAP